MERSKEYEDLAIALAEVRPTPRDDFAAELDELAAAGFPRKSRFGGLRAAGLHIRRLSPQRLLTVSGATALAAIVTATVVVTSNDSTPGPVALDSRQRVERPHHVQFSEPILPAAVPEAGGGTAGSSGAAAESDSSETQSAPALPASSAINNAFGRAVHRDIERSAEIGLLAGPADIAGDSAKVFSAVHDARGIVLHSTTTAGRHAGANFDLLIPSARLGDALAAFSAIDEVRSRHEATADITAPTVALGEQLQDSRAKTAGLLAQLASAETEAESEAIGFQLHAERRHAAQLRARLAQLHRRTSFSRVSVRIESGASTESGGAWGIGDAFGDARHILGVAAGVTVIGLAILAPLFLIGLLAWLARRAWLRRARDRALA